MITSFKHLNIEGVESITATFSRPNWDNIISSIDITIGDAVALLDIRVVLQNGDTIVLHPELNYEEIQELFDENKEWTKEEFLDWLMVNEL